MTNKCVKLWMFHLTYTFTLYFSQIVWRRGIGFSASVTLIKGVQERCVFEPRQGLVRYIKQRDLTLHVIA